MQKEANEKLFSTKKMMLKTKHKKKKTNNRAIPRNTVSVERERCEREKNRFKIH